MKVSIVTTSFNSIETIRATIDSVLQQTYPDIEYIIKDGGSTDGTVDIIKEYEPEFHGRMKWTSEKDKGIYDGMNKGIQMSSGDVIGTLNSDDFFTNEHVIENLVTAMKEKKVDAVYGDIHFVRNNDLKTITRYYSSKRFRPFWLRFGFMPAHPSFYLKREIYKKAGPYKTDYKIGSDFEMMVRLFHKFHISYYYLQQDFVTMRTGGASTKNINSHMTLLKEDTRACRENGIYTNRLMVAIKYFYKVFEFTDLLHS